MILLDLKDSASKLFKKWKNYRMKDWTCILVAGTIFILGYFLGTMSWRKGSSAVIVILNFISGSTGFIYFCYKGMKIISETHEELISMNFEDVAFTKEQHAIENDYVLRQSVFKRTKRRNSKEMCFDSTGNQLAASATNTYESVSPLYTNYHKQMNGKGKEGKLSDFDLYEQDMPFERYENFFVSAEDFASNVVEDKTDVNDDIVLIKNVCYKLPNIGDENSNLSLTTSSSFAETSHEIYSSVENPHLDEFKNTNIDEFKNRFIDRESNYENLQTTLSNHFSKSPEIDEICSLRKPLERFKSVSEHNLYESSNDRLFPYKQQRTVQSSTSENFFPTVQNDFMQHYKRPRSQSFLFDSLRFECTTPPDPYRHLKPTKDTRKPLPPEPQQSNFSVDSKTNGNFYSFPSPIQSSIKSSELANNLFQTPVPLNHKSLVPQFQSPALYSSPIPSLQQDPRFESPGPKIRRFLSPEVKIRRCEVLARHRSHPITLGSRSPPRVVQSPPPRSRPCPPNKINISLQRSKQSPPSIPRKIGLTPSTFKDAR